MATIDPDTGEEVPRPGKWPVGPQQDVVTRDERIWIDGCFDFFHHGHAGVMLQSRRLGNELFVGLHSDEDIRKNKGPTVMNLAERCAAVDACRWSTLSVPHAPYVTSLPWITHYGCRYVIHGDDVTSDADGNDCYRFVKKAGRFKVVKRTPGISTTDLVGRMLLCTRNHFIKDFEAHLDADSDKMDRVKEYASDENGKEPCVEVWSWAPKHIIHRRRSSVQSSEHSSRRHDPGKGTFSKIVGGNGSKPGQRIVYVDGGFDLFSSGHIAFLKQVAELEKEGAYLIAGVHDDDVINHWKGVNYPIMNVFERGLCVLQCKYVQAVVFGAPYTPSKHYLESLPYGTPNALYHGPTSFMPGVSDPYTDAKALNIYYETPAHDFQHVNAGEIVERILKSRAQYEERQRVKGVKNVGEEAVRKREEMERDAERLRQQREIESQFGA